MAIEIQEIATNQTVDGQPVEGANGNVETTTTESDTGGNVEVETSDAGATSASGETKPVAATVAIAPEALRQITTLSSSNRALKKQLEEANAKLAAVVPAADVAAKLAELAALQNETPRAYLKRTGKNLDDIAADVLAGDNDVQDPRVDGLTATVDELKKQLADKAVADAKANEDKVKTDSEQFVIKAQEYVTVMIEANPGRWETIKGNGETASEAVKAAMIVGARDYKDQRITKETADSILQDCLDEAETYALAAKMVADRKKAPPEVESLVKRKGLEIQDSTHYASKKGEDGKGANGAHTPKVTIDGARGPTRSATVKRGPTDVRTARARAMRIANGGDPNE